MRAAARRAARDRLARGRLAAVRRGRDPGERRARVTAARGRRRSEIVPSRTPAPERGVLAARVEVGDVVRRARRRRRRRSRPSADVPDDFFDQPHARVVRRGVDHRVLVGRVRLRPSGGAPCVPVRAAAERRAEPRSWYVRDRRGRTAPSVACSPAGSTSARLRAGARAASAAASRAASARSAA